MINIGTNPQSNGNGLKTTIPEGYNVLWLRVSNHVWHVLRVMYLDGQNEEIGKFVCGKRYLNEYSPDGTLSDSYAQQHMWCHIPVFRSGALAIYSDRNTDGWISGIAFGKNLWNHAKNSALAFYWAVNGGTAIEWSDDTWNNDVLGKIPSGKTSELIVPIVNSGKDKLFYIIEHNSNWNGVMHSNIYVEGKLIERFRSTYDTPFSRHYNSKLYQRYVAARIPKDLIPQEKRFISIKIEMTSQDNNINIREVGTHDYIE